MASATGTEARGIFLDLLEAWADEIRALVDHLVSLGASRIAAAGVSMGGHLALAAPGREPRIQAVVAFNADPVWDNRPGSPHLDPAAWAQVPLLAVTADADQIVPPAPIRMFASLLNARFGADHATSLTYPGGHIMDPADWEAAWLRTLAWLERRFP